MSQTLHLMTQRGQPYGSRRRCCEECGTMIALNVKYGACTDDPEVYAAPPDGYVACNSADRVGEGQT